MDQCKLLERMETIGKRIERLRKSCGIVRQADLASQIGVTQSTLSSIESKNLEFSAAVLYALSRALSVTPEYIMYGIGEDEDMGSLELAQIYKALPLAERETLLRMARVLLPDLTNRIAA